MSLRLTCPKCRSARVWPEHRDGRTIWVCVDCRWHGKRHVQKTPMHTRAENTDPR